MPSTTEIQLAFHVTGIHLSLFFYLDSSRANYYSLNDVKERGEETEKNLNRLGSEHISSSYPGDV